MRPLSTLLWHQAHDHRLFDDTVPSAVPCAQEFESYLVHHLGSFPLCQRGA